uniref:Uncharacterized protein n=1 Tax=Cucumis melo TaxID=3656 RepID=A0A9I9DL38_CUCME
MDRSMSKKVTPTCSFQSRESNARRNIRNSLSPNGMLTMSEHMVHHDSSSLDLL